MGSGDDATDAEGRRGRRRGRRWCRARRRPWRRGRRGTGWRRYPEPATATAATMTPAAAVETARKSKRRFAPQPVHTNRPNEFSHDRLLSSPRQAPLAPLMGSARCGCRGQYCGTSVTCPSLWTQKSPSRRSRQPTQQKGVRDRVESCPGTDRDERRLCELFSSVNRGAPIWLTTRRRSSLGRCSRDTARARRSDFGAIYTRIDRVETHR